MTRKLVVFCAFTLGAITLATHGQAQSPFTARSLYLLCSSDPNEAKEDHESAQTTCGAYILGLTDGMFMMQLLADHSMVPCMPKESAIDVTKVRQIFNKYLEGHPQSANNSAGLVMGMALADAYKCRN